MADPRFTNDARALIEKIAFRFVPGAKEGSRCAIWLDMGKDGMNGTEEKAGRFAKMLAAQLKNKKFPMELHKGVRKNITLWGEIPCATHDIFRQTAQDFILGVAGITGLQPDELLEKTMGLKSLPGRKRTGDAEDNEPGAMIIDVDQPRGR